MNTDDTEMGIEAEEDLDMDAALDESDDSDEMAGSSDDFEFDQAAGELQKPDVNGFSVPWGLRPTGNLHIQTNSGLVLFKEVAPTLKALFDQPDMKSYQGFWKAWHDTARMQKMGFADFDAHVRLLDLLHVTGEPVWSPLAQLAYVVNYLTPEDADRLAAGFLDVVREHATRQAAGFRATMADVKATLYEGTPRDVQQADAMFSPLRRTQIPEIEALMQEADSKGLGIPTTMWSAALPELNPLALFAITHTAMAALHPPTISQQGIVALDFKLPFSKMFRRHHLAYSSVVWPAWLWRMSLTRLRIVCAPWALGPLTTDDNASAGSLGQTSLAKLVDARSARLLAGTILGDAGGSLLGLSESLFLRTSAAKDRAYGGADGAAALLGAAPGGPDGFIRVLAGLTKLDESGIKGYLEDRGGLTERQAKMMYKLDHSAALLEPVGVLNESRVSAQQAARQQQGRNARLRQGIWQILPKIQEIGRLLDEVAAGVQLLSGEAVGKDIQEARAEYHASWDTAERALVRVLTAADAAMIAQQAQAGLASEAEQHQPPAPVVELYHLALRKEQQEAAGNQLLPPPPLEPQPHSVATQACAAQLAAMQRTHSRTPRGPALRATLAQHVPQPPRDAIYQEVYKLDGGQLQLRLNRSKRAALRLEPPMTSHTQPLVLLSDVGGQTLPFVMPTHTPSAGMGRGNNNFCGDGVTLFKLLKGVQDGASLVIWPASEEDSNILYVDIDYGVPPLAARVALGSKLVEAMRLTEDGRELPARELVDAALQQPQPRPPDALRVTVAPTSSPAHRLKLRADERKMLGISVKSLVAILELAPGLRCAYPLQWKDPAGGLTGPGVSELMSELGAKPGDVVEIWPAVRPGIQVICLAMATPDAEPPLSEADRALNWAYGVGSGGGGAQLDNLPPLDVVRRRQQMAAAQAGHEQPSSAAQRKTVVTVHSLEGGGHLFKFVSDNRKALGLVRQTDSPFNPNIVIVRQAPGKAGAYVLTTDSRGSFTHAGRGFNLFRRALGGVGDGTRVTFWSSSSEHPSIMYAEVESHQQGVVLSAGHRRAGDPQPRVTQT